MNIPHNALYQNCTTGFAPMNKMAARIIFVLKSTVELLKKYLEFTFCI